MIDHISVTMSDYRAAVHFYDEALNALGYAKLFTSETDKLTTVAYGKDAPMLWISAGPKGAGAVHLAFRAQSKAAVDAFYAAAMAAGARDNGPPGYRPQYYSGYYAAFVLDTDGNNIEAVFHDSSFLGSH